MKKNYLNNKFFWGINVFFNICKIIPKNKKIWIFGAWQGDKYSDNSRYFYEYLMKKNLDKELKIIWITCNKDILKKPNIKKKLFSK